MSPERRTWVEAMIARLAPSAAALRDEPGRGPANVARTLAGVVSRLEAELAAAPTPATAAMGAEIAKLERSLAAIQPRPGPYGLVINGCDLMGQVRHQLASRLAELRGDHAVVPPAAGVASIAVEPRPVPEGAPFTAGPQLGFFDDHLSCSQDIADHRRPTSSFSKPA